MSFYNENSRKLQRQFDSVRLADQLQRTRLHTRLTVDDRSIVESATYFFLATTNAAGQPECSIKGGNKGFVSCLSDSLLSFSNYDGNGMFRSLGNIKSNPRVGLLFVNFGNEPTKLRINGRARFNVYKLKDPTRITVHVKITEIFPNCPRYLPNMTTQEGSVYNPAKGYTPPDPEWKSKPDLQPFLPKAQTES